MIAAAAIGVGVWIILAAISAPVIGRAIRDTTPAADPERAVYDAQFAAIVSQQFPQYRKDLTGGAA